MSDKMPKCALCGKDDVTVSQRIHYPQLYFWYCECGATTNGGFASIHAAIADASRRAPVVLTEEERSDVRHALMYDHEVAEYRLAMIIKRLGVEG